MSIQIYKKQLEEHRAKVNATKRKQTTKLKTTKQAGSVSPEKEVVAFPNSSKKSSKDYQIAPQKYNVTNLEPIDMAAHMQLLGESLTLVATALRRQVCFNVYLNLCLCGFITHPYRAIGKAALQGCNGLNMPTKGVGSRDYPYFTNLPKNAGLRFADRCFFWGSVTPQPPSRRPCTHSASLVNLYSYGFGALFIPRELELPAVQKIYDNSKNSQIGSEVFCNSLENHKPFSPIL